MTDEQWKAFVTFRDEYRFLCEEWGQLAPKLLPLQKNLAGTDYNVETSVVFNRAYDDIKKEDEINLIVIGDNPGKDEQLAKNNRYFVGKSGMGYRGGDEAVEYLRKYRSTTSYMLYDSGVATIDPASVGIER